MNPKNLVIRYAGSPNIDDTEVEIVERKGLGHPDTLCDTIAEKISRAYSQYTLEKFGVILRHMVDKIAISGGSARVMFGGGEMLTPIRVYLNCRFTRTFQEQDIPYLDIATKVIRDHFAEVLPLLDLDEWLFIIDNTHFAPGPGVVYESDGTTRNERQFFFEVPDKKMASNHDNSKRSNDTSTAVGYYPLSTTESAVVLIETTLNSTEFKRENPHVGTDIKVMAKRVGMELDVTACIPFISVYTPDYDFYKKELERLRVMIIDLMRREHEGLIVSVSLNTRDDPERSDYYLTLTGSAIESGDEGVVGRGNRHNGVIPFCRKMSMEACCGKNPVYHVGKVYTALCWLISSDIHQIGLESYVYLTSQMGRNLDDPWLVYVEVLGSEPGEADKARIAEIVKDRLSSVSQVTQAIVQGAIALF